MTAENLILACSVCGAKNRLPISRLNDAAKCGKCGAVLPTDKLGRPFVISDANFNDQVIRSKMPVLVDCWAPWCGPCRSLGPVIDALALKYKGRLKIAKLNLDENPVTGSRYAISSVPTLLFVKEGRVVDQVAGALPKEQIEEHIAGII